MSSSRHPSTSSLEREDVDGDDRWTSMHHHYLLQAREKEPDVLFIGDSLAHRATLCKLWGSLFEPLHTLNFGVPGDKTQNVLWRIENGELEGIQPKVVVVFIGTNNVSGGYSAQETLQGVRAVVQGIRDMQPDTQIIVVGIPPRGEKPNALRDVITQVNEALPGILSALPNCTFLAVDPSLFINVDGLIFAEDMYDYLHLSDKGYQKILEPLLEEVQNLLKTFVKVESTQGM